MAATHTLLFLLATALAAPVAAGATTCYPVDPLRSANPPELLRSATGFVGLNELRISVLAPRVEGRSDIAFSVGPCALGNLSDHLVDGSEGSGSSSECNDIVALDHAWSLLAARCNVSVVHASDHDEYTVALTSTYSERVGAIHGVDIVRRVSTDSVFRLRFATYVSATTQVVQIHAPAHVQAALQSVVFRASSTGRSATLQLVTGVQTPYQLSQLYSVAPYDEAVAVSAEQDPVAAQTIGGALLQTWSIGIVPPPSTCRLSALELLANFTVSCGPSVSAAACPLAQPEPIVFELELSTDSFCPDVVDDAAATARLASYRDAAMTTEATGFVLGATVYVAALVSWDKAPVDHSEVVSLVATGTAVRGGSANLTAALGSDYSDPARARVWFVASSDVFQAPAEGSTAEALLSAVLRLHYAGSARKRNGHGGSEGPATQVVATARVSVAAVHEEQHSGAACAGPLSWWL
eukprot:m51a1_g11653 hypothetical protein (467) ;mRNA; r:155-1555